MNRKLLAVICLLLNFYDLNAYPDKFNEELFIKALHSGHVYTYFQFTTEWLLNNSDDCKY